MALPIAAGAVTDVIAATGVPAHPIGQLFRDESNGKLYMYVQNNGATVTAAGDVCGFFSTTPANGSISRNASTVVESTLGTAMPVAGVAVSAIAASGGWGYLQVGGHCSNITTDEGVAAGDPLVCDGGAAPSFVADTAIAGEEHLVFAIADAADATAVGSGWLRCWAGH